MISREQWQAFEAQGWVQTIEFTIGILLLIVALIVGPLPGPGGIFFAVPGLVLVLRTSLWARKNYVRFKRWQPRAGRWTDWALRRKSAQRREAIIKANQPLVDASRNKSILHILMLDRVLDRLLGR